MTPDQSLPAGMVAVDWSAPLEAVCKRDGRVVPVTFLSQYGDVFETVECPDSQETNRKWQEDGTDWCCLRMWFLRNRTTPDQSRSVDQGREGPTFTDIAARAQILANERGGDYDSLSREEFLDFMVEYDNALSALTTAGEARQGRVTEASTGAVSEDAIRHLAIRSPLNCAIYSAVREYRMSNMCDADDASIAYPLVDLMSNPAPADIGTGEMEMIALADEIEAAILAHRTAAQSELVEENARLRAAITEALALLSTSRQPLPDYEGARAALRNIPSQEGPKHG